MTSGTALEAVLWDMDGLLVDSEPVWSVAEAELCASWGLEFSPQTKAAMIGRRLDESVPILIAACGVAADPVASADWLLARMVELFGRGLALRPGAAALLTSLAEHGVPQALVSSSFRVLVDALPARLRAFFAVSVAGDEVARAKPDPGGYLEALRRLGARPQHCVVLEDSHAGARAGAAAGCRVVVVPSVSGVVASPDWQLVDSLLDLDPDRLRGLLG